MATPVQFYSSANVDEHVAVIGKYVEKSLRDPETIKLARKIVTGRYDYTKDPATGGQVAIIEAWGKFYRAPPGSPCKARDGECEITRVWDFIVLNLRYTFDPQETDTFATVRESLESGGGDCLPEGTKILKRPGIFVPIEEIEVGDEIYDGTGWTRVEKHWDKGVLPTRDILLNNGSVLRCTDDHRLFTVPRVRRGTNGTAPGTADLAQEMRAGDVGLDMDLLQPTELLPEGRIHLSPAEACLLGAYVAEGWMEKAHTSISGVADGKGLRERVLIALDSLGWTYHADTKYIALHSNEGAVRELLGGCGSRALDKRLPTLDYDRETTENILTAMNLGDAGYSNTGTLVYSTISETLALQYRILQRRMGRSTSVKRVDKHGGLGTSPIYRVTVRKRADEAEKVCKVWARVKGIAAAPECHVYDFQTTSGRIYLPEQDIIVHNCDDATIMFAALLKAIGFKVVARVISTTGKNWEHIYALAGLPHEAPKRWVSLDATVEGFHPGDEFKPYKSKRDFLV